MGKGVTTKSTVKRTSLSSTRMTSRQSGKMSGAHGVTNGGGKHKTLYNASGALGSDCPTMGHNFKQGPFNISKKGY